MRNRSRIMATVVAAAMLPLVAPAASCIVSPGYDSAIMSKEGSATGVSSATDLATGALSTAAASTPLEARFRTWLDAALGTKFSSFKALGLFIMLR